MVGTSNQSVPEMASDTGDLPLPGLSTYSSPGVIVALSCAWDPPNSPFCLGNIR